jgi:aminoglycoside phosphotransferase
VRSGHDLLVPAADLPEVAPLALADAARRANLDDADAQLIRLFSTAVYHLPAADAVARIALVTSPESVTRLATSVRVTRWLDASGFPAVEPVPVDQPMLSHGCAITFWRYLPQQGPAPRPADLGCLLRRLHHLDPPPFPLPSYRPLVSVRRAIEASQAINDEERAWLTGACERLLHLYDQLEFELPPGMIHGDAWWGNLLRDGDRVVLVDWDNVSTGPREIDLIPTLQAARFGLPEHERDAFIAAYGHDIRTWPGYPVLLQIRALSTTSALLRDAHRDPAARDQLRVRLTSLRTGDTRQWTTF